MRLRIFAALCALALAGCATTSPEPAPMSGRTAAKATPAPAGGPDFSSYLDRAPLLPEYTRIELVNGAVLLLLEKPEVPLIGFEAVIRGGSTADPQGCAGTAS